MWNVQKQKMYTPLFKLKYDLNVCKTIIQIHFWKLEKKD